MHMTEPRFATYVVVNAHTDEVHSEHPTRRMAQSAKDAAGDHALRVRGGQKLEHPASSIWRRILHKAGL